MTDVVAILAANLGHLEHEDGTPFVFPAHQADNPTLPAEYQQQIQGVNQGIAEAIVHLLTKNGLRVVESSTLSTPQMLGSTQVVGIHCKICGGLLIKTNMGADGLVSIPPTVINPACSENHVAA